MPVIRSTLGWYCLRKAFRPQPPFCQDLICSFFLFAYLELDRTYISRYESTRKRQKKSKLGWPSRRGGKAIWTNKNGGLRLSERDRFESRCQALAKRNVATGGKIARPVWVTTYFIGGGIMNGGTGKQITWTVEGLDRENGHVRADEFLDKVDHLLSALNGIDKMVSDAAQPTLYYRIVALSHSSPISITLEPVIKPRVTNPPRDYIAVRHDRFFKELEQPIGTSLFSDDVDDALLEDFRDLATGRGQSFQSAVISNQEEKIPIDETFEANVTKMLGEEYTSYGWVEGKLEALNVHGRARRVWLYPAVGPQRICCDFLPGTRTQLLEAADKFVRAQGWKHFRPQSLYPFRVKVMEFEVMDSDEQSTLRDLRGIAPQATGEGTSVDFVRSLRDEWD